MKLSVIACVVFIALTVFGCTQSTPPPEPEAPTNELIGVWKATEVKYPQMGDRDAQTITEPQPRLYIFTNKHYSQMEVTGDKPRADLPEEPTDAQIAAAYWQFRANSGTYEVKGSNITFLPIVAKGPNVTNSPSPFSADYKFEGDSLIILFETSFGLIEVKLTRLE